MSPIIDLQRSLRRLGKIRMGSQVEGTNKKGEKYTRPAKLKEWRLTSPNPELLAHAAEVYGGDVAIWEGAPGEGRQYELFTTSDTLDIIIPPGDPSFMQYYEKWSAGGCERRCDGQTETLTDSPCLCPADAAERDAMAKKGNACKMTTRMSVLLPKIPDLGTWMLESHGFYAAVELGGLFELKQQRAPGAFIDARLRLDPRTVKRDGETRHYIVPVIEIPDLMAGELAAANVAGLSGPVAEISGGGAAIGAAQPAIAAAPAPPPPPPRAAPPQPPATTRAQPALPGEEDAGRPFTDEDEKLVAPVWYKTFAQAVREGGFDDETRHALVAYGTNGRTRSSKTVRKGDEAKAVKDAWEALQRGELAEVVADDGTVSLVPVEAAAHA